MELNKLHIVQKKSEREKNEKWKGEKKIRKN